MVVKPRVLIVDDEPGVLSALRRGLSIHGVEADMCCDLVTAETLLREAEVAGTPYDVVVSDYDLGDGRTGRDVLAAAQDVSPTTSRVIMSGGNPDRLDALLADGLAWAALRKPFNVTELRDLIRTRRKTP